MSQSKCEMARLRYCHKSYFAYCNADDTDVERCPYLKAIEEIAMFAVENIRLEDKDSIPKDICTLRKLFYKDKENESK